MELTFLGHNGLLVAGEGRGIYIDPILVDGQGKHSDSTGIFPPRRLVARELPSPAAILLTHEHSDHFSLRSLALFPKGTEVLLHPLVPTFVVQLIERIGLAAKRVDFLEPLRYDSVEITLYPASISTLLWERRVAQVLLTDLSNPAATAFTCVDAATSEQYLADLAAERKPQPAALLVSNNSQTTVSGIRGALQSSREAFDPERSGCTGLSILNSVLFGSRRNKIRPRSTIMIGGGIIRQGEILPPDPFHDFRLMTRIAESFSPGHRILAPIPGTRLRIDSAGATEISPPATFIEPHPEEYRRLLDERDAFVRGGGELGLRAATEEPASRVGRSEAITFALAEVQKISRAVFCSEIGNKMRLECLTLCGENHPLMYFGLKLDETTSIGFSANLCGTVEITKEEETQAAFGMSMYFRDFAALCNGDLQIWDLTGGSISHWFPGDRFVSMVALFYCYFGEPAQPDLARKSYESIVEELTQ